MFQRAAAAAASLTGKRFGLLVASSLVATSAIVASALSNPTDSGPLAALLGRTLAAGSPPAFTAPAPHSPQAGASASSGQAAKSSPLDAAASPKPLGARPAPQTAPEKPVGEPEPPTALPKAGRIKHVFIVSLSSPGYEAAFGPGSQMPYLSGTLRPQGTLLSNYALLGNGGIANSIAAISGQPPNAQTNANCPTYAEFPSGAKANGKGIVRGDGCVYPVETLTLADQLTSARFTWRAYMEGMVDESGQPGTCVHPGSGEVETAIPGGYAAAQNPFVYFHSLLDLGGCAVNDVSIDQLGRDLGKVSKTPSFSFIAPTPCDAGAIGYCATGSPEGPNNADAFLARWVPKILSSSAFKKDGLLIVVFDAVTSPPGEAGTTASAENPLRVGALLISRFAAKGGTQSVPFNPYSLFRSVEELFGLQRLAMGADPKTKTFAPELLAEAGGD